MEVPQMKTAKVNVVIVCAGVDKHSDWFTSLGDYLTAAPNLTIYDNNEGAWLFPKLQDTDSPAASITSFVRALEVGDGGQVKYRDVAVPDLPHRATAGTHIPIIYAQCQCEQHLPCKSWFR
jgi:hypothetical protein